METYYVFLLDDAGHIAWREPIEAETEAEAVENASAILEARRHHRGAELWLRGRRLIRVIAGSRSKA